MFKRATILASWMLLLMIVPTRAADHLPPPLGFASLNEYSERYHVYDFEAQSVQTIERDTPLGENKHYYGDSTPPDRVTIQSPYDASIRFEFISTQPVEPNTHIDYDLYRLTKDGNRKRVLQHADINYPEKDYWSPNGDYLYVKTDTQLTGSGTLNQINLRTNQVKPTLQPVPGIGDCQLNGRWCILTALGVRDGEKYPVTLYGLDRNSGTIINLGTSVLIFTLTHWLDNTLTYAIASSVDHYAIHRFDFTTRTDELITEIEATYPASWQFSSDSHWAVIEAKITKNVFGGLYAVDVNTPASNPILLTTQFAPLSQSRATSMRWVDDHTFVFSTLEEAGGRNISVVTFPDGKIRMLAQFDRNINFFDHDWSPDGRWIALAKDQYDPAAEIVYLVSLDDGLHQIHLSDSTEQPICIGWFSAEIYRSQQANLCDMTLGEG